MTSDKAVRRSRDPQRLRLQNRFQTGIGLVAGLVSAAIVLPNVFISNSIAGKASLLLLGLPLLALSLRYFRSCIILTQDGIEVRGILRDKRVEWSDVVGFNLRRQNALANNAVYIGVELRDGKRAETSGLTAASRRSEFAAWSLRAMEEYRNSLLFAEPD